MIYNDCDMTEHEYNTTEEYRVDEHGVSWTNFWFLKKGDILIHLNHKAKNTHSLAIRQWCWAQGWNRIYQIRKQENNQNICFSTVPDQRYSNRVLAFKFHNTEGAKQAATLFKMRWG